MDIQKLHESALESSRKALFERFDPTAYIVYVLAQKSLESQSEGNIEDSEIDDNIKDVFSDFSKYYKAKNENAETSELLQSMMKSMKKIITELYYQSTATEKAMIKGAFPLDFFKNL